MANIIQSAAAEVTLICRKSNSFGIVQEVTDANDAPYPLAGATGELKVTDSAGATVLLFNAAPDLVFDSVLGTITLSKTEEQMDLAPGKYRYYFKLTFLSGLVVTWWVGDFVILDLAE